MVRRPSRWAVRTTRQAISPRLAMSTEENMPAHYSIAGKSCRRVLLPKPCAQRRFCVLPGCAMVDPAAGGDSGTGAAGAAGAASRADDWRRGGAADAGRWPDEPAPLGSGVAGSAFMMLTGGIED